MIDLLRKYRWYFIGGGLLLTALLFFSLNLRNRQHAGGVERVMLQATSPVTGVVSSAGSGLTGFWRDYIDMVDAKKENRKLLEIIKEQNVRIVAGNDAWYENQRLRKLLDMKESLKLPSVAASVVSEDSSSWFRTIVINRGEVDGIREGMPVVATDGVVGQVVKVAPGVSRVLLLTDHANAMAALVQRSRARGVVRGKGDRCSFDFAAREDDVKVGDTVVTSGVGGIFPKGLPVGQITMVKKGEYGMFQTIELRPVVNLSNLEEVLVLLQKEHD